MLNLHVENVDDLAIVECKGRIVRSEAAFALREVVTSQQEDARIILLDFSEVSAIEGGGLGMLVFLQRWAFQHNISLKVCNPTKTVQDRLELANAIPDFEIVTPDEMLAIVVRAHRRRLSEQPYSGLPYNQLHTMDHGFRG